LRRKPLIWDNLHANDYDGHRFFCGPYAGRSPALRNEVSGLLTNPNCEFPLNFVPLATFAEFARGGDSWDARAAYLAALRDWWPRFTTPNDTSTSPALEFEELLLFADCYYLPFADGEKASALWRSAQELLAKPAAEWGGAAEAFRRQAARLRATCARLSELSDRPLFHALSRRAWELREELELLERYVEFKSDPTRRALPCRLDSHLPGTCRGGFVARLQRLLVLLPDGAIVPANPSAHAEPEQAENAPAIAQPASS
jgi:protein O-GlcNAcase/histone acetyltransferase